MADDIEDEAPGEAPSRDQDLLGNRPRGGEAPKSGIRLHLDKLFDSVSKGFEDQAERSDAIQDYWDCYNCEPNGNRYYNGISDNYLPLIHDATEAIVTRDVNQLFPQGGRYIQAIAADGSTQSAIVALLDHYILQGQVETQVAEPLVRHSIIEGQLNLYMDWAEDDRQVVSRETHGPRDPVTGMEGPGEEIEDITEEDVIEGFPVWEVLHDSDVLILPATADNPQAAIAAGGSVTIVRYWSKEKVKAMGRAGNIREDDADRLAEEMGKVANQENDTTKHVLDQVGIRKSGREAVVWEVWSMIPLTTNKKDKAVYSESGRNRICRTFFGPGRTPLGCKRNPYWNDRCPLISKATKKMARAAKGPSLVKYVESMQYEANDAINQGADAATLAAFPVVIRDPEKVDGPLVYNVGAVWDAPPGSVEVLTFPDLTPRAATRVSMAQGAIFQNLNVNPSMLPQQGILPTTGRESQAKIAQQQAVDLLTTAMRTKALQGVLTEAAAWVVDLDYQYRDRDLTVRMFGEAGKKAEMQAVAPLQNRNGLTFVWRGGDQVRQNATLAQQATALLNVFQNPVLQQLLAAEGKRLTPGKMMEQMVINGFGPEIGRTVITDAREQLTNPPDLEDEWMLSGLEANVHPLDDDNEHMRVHAQSIQQTGDPTGLIRGHFQRHQQQQQLKIEAQQMMQMQQQMQGAAGGGPGRPPGSARPQPGAAPAGPRLLKGPNGMIHPDAMSRAGGVGMPRKM